MLQIRCKILPMACSIAAGCLALGPTARGQEASEVKLDRGPDFLYTLGVGSRAVAMGDAFTAIADDASATFWNPGRLGDLTRTNAMLELRSNYHYATNATATNIGAEGAAGTDTLKISSAGPQLTFGSVTVPFGDVRAGEGALDGTLGLSYAVGGYFNYRSVSDLTRPADGDLPEVRVTSTTREVVRNAYTTLAYGRNILLSQKGRPAGKLGLGIGVFRVRQDISGDTDNLTRVDDPTVPPVETLDHIGGAGHGYGVLLGMAYDVPNSPFQLGATYRTKTRLNFPSGSVEASFGKHIPARATFGVAYARHGVGATETRKGSDLILSADIHRFSGANEDGNIDYRRAVTNYHFGMEYTPERPIFTIPGTDARTATGEWAASTPLRLGFRTNKTGNLTGLLKDTNVVSFGFAYEKGPRSNVQYSVEPSFEWLTGYGHDSLQFTITGIVNFGR